MKRPLSIILTLVLLGCMLFALPLGAQAATGQETALELYTDAVQKMRGENPEITAYITMALGQWTGDASGLNFLNSNIPMSSIPARELYDAAFFYDIRLDDFGIPWGEMGMDMLSCLELTFPAQKLLYTPYLTTPVANPNGGVPPQIMPIKAQNAVVAPDGSASFEILLADQNFANNQPNNQYPFDSIVARFTDQRFLPSPYIIRQNLTALIRNNGCSMAPSPNVGTIQISTKDAKITAQTDAQDNLIALQHSFTYKVVMLNNSISMGILGSISGNRVENEVEVAVTYVLPIADPPVDPPHICVKSGWKTVLAPQVGVAGLENRVCIFCGDEMATREIAPLKPGCFINLPGWLASFFTLFMPK